MFNYIWNFFCDIFSIFFKNDKEEEDNDIHMLNEVFDEPIKVGLLIGCNYKGTESELNGCINDVQTVHNELFPKRDYDYILTLTDETPILPTRKNILTNLKQILEKLEDGDTFFFHCSGHGTQQNDLNHDEIDGKDEAFVSLDMKIITDDIFQSIFQSVHKKVNIFILMDCCHSGTIIDLPYSLQSPNGNIIKNNSSIFYPNIVMISGCQDKQVSYDSFINNKHQGALTFAFKTALHNFGNNEPIEVRTFLDIIHNILNDRNYPQLPQLSFSNPNCKYLQI
jgi:hypothetical protein